MLALLATLTVIGTRQYTCRVTPRYATLCHAMSRVTILAVIALSTLTKLAVIAQEVAMQKAEELRREKAVAKITKMAAKSSTVKSYYKTKVRQG